MVHWHKKTGMDMKSMDGFDSGWFESLLNESSETHTPTWEGNMLYVACGYTTYKLEDTHKCVLTHTLSTHTHIMFLFRPIQHNNGPVSRQIFTEWTLYSVVVQT